MSTREEFVIEVKSWIGTPFHHLARVKGVGVDCVGLAVGACRALEIPVQDLSYYSRNPINRTFDSHIDEQTDAGDFPLMLGDLLKFKIRTETQHLAIVTCLEPVRMTHAYILTRKVIENGFEDVWRERLVGIRRIRGLT